MTDFLEPISKSTVSPLQVENVNPWVGIYCKRQRIAKALNLNELLWYLGEEKIQQTWKQQQWYVEVP